MAESIMSTLKRELTRRYPWKTRLDGDLALVTYIGRYNSRRRHRSPKDDDRRPDETAIPAADAPAVQSGSHPGDRGFHIIEPMWNPERSNLLNPPASTS
jgi:transposase InsO family protein